MGASRTPAASRSEEMLRLAGRTTEQHTRIKMILEYVKARLSSMTNVLDSYNDQSIVPNVNGLISAIEEFLGKLQPIMKDVSESLEKYATNLKNDTGKLSSGIESIKSTLGDL